MTKHTIELPASITVRTVGGKPVNLNVEALPPAVIAHIFEGGAKIILTNTYNSGGKDVPEAERLANMQKRMDAWARGDYTMTGGPRDSLAADMRDAYYNEKGCKDSKERSAVDKKIRTLVTDTYGEKETATFARFLDAVALKLARERAEPKATDEAIKEAEAALRVKLQEKYEALANALRASREEVTADIDVSDMID